MGALVSLARPKSVPCSDVIHLDGQAVYAITQRAVIEEGGKWNPILRGSGDLLGDLALCGRLKSVYSARALSLTSFLVIPASRFLRLAAREPAIGAALNCALAQHAQRLGTWRAVDRLHSCARIAWLLLELSEALSNKGQPADWVSGVNQNQMAQLAGMSQASVENDLRLLREAGAISTSYRKIQILDRALLARWVPEFM
ncbi:Crp/Fnr family transcriptional regulator [Streptomyces hyaluromycini]|uniref:Crp/Fnr family transcriptional regulator n=1 Tax=Streptomyces hyaluromycini TaxID=1377993 RepID=A0ABV1WPV7_9ACTN